MSDTVYCYPPDYTVLNNRLGLRDADALDRAERRLVYLRQAEDIPTGDFDLAHLRAIHRHLFQDVFDWAGDIRTVEISKGGSQFQFMRYIETGMADVHRRIKTHDYLRKLSPDEFADLAAEILGDINYVHPFREGNGRTQVLFIKQLAQRAGHDIDLTKLRGDDWMAASREAHQANYQPLRQCLRETIRQPTRTQKRPRSRER
jgi:cell filamentation protein